MSAPPNDDPALERSLYRWRVLGVAVFALLVVAFPAYHVLEGHRRAEARTQRSAAQVAAGRALWRVNCASCHGAHGEGGTGPTLNAREFLRTVDEGQIRGLIETGIPGSLMVAWWNAWGGPLTSDQIEALVSEIESWAPAAPSRPNWWRAGTPATPAAR